MDALVALSTSLQRNRTAIRLLTELLVEHIEDLGVGEIVLVEAGALGHDMKPMAEKTLPAVKVRRFISRDAAPGDGTAAEATAGTKAGKARAVKKAPKAKKTAAAKKSTAKKAAAPKAKAKAATKSATTKPAAKKSAPKKKGK